ncbi:hypothetical protein ACFFSH_32065 [Streptomyces filamentosus]|uniref:Uncharacterized protein n=1 Tax=Streptomyces filamentosus TaxID=67294 RepID=A0A919EJU2_STRFL|nr:hypothetical protein [Streptomyces filamentosus]KAA6218711.1 hypothetical protein CP979_18775 [Streptomyces filamentosus]GHF92544.1 hypothetical protein GCM10017667_22690 [Streptomyces filamentosus]
MTAMCDEAVTRRRGGAGGRAPVLLLLLALVALFAGLCHGAPGHGGHTGPGHAATGPAGSVAFAPAFAGPAHGAVPHGCGQDGEGHAAELPPPAQTATTPQLDPPGPGTPVTAGRTTPLPPAAELRNPRTRAGPRPEPGRLLIALGVDRN